MSDQVAPPKAPAPPLGGAVVKRETNGSVFPCLFTMKMAPARPCDLDLEDYEDVMPIASLNGLPPAAVASIGGIALPVPLTGTESGKRSRLRIRGEFASTAMKSGPAPPPDGVMLTPRCMPGMDTSTAAGEGATSPRRCAPVSPSSPPLPSALVPTRPPSPSAALPSTPGARKSRGSQNRSSKLHLMRR